MADNYQIQMRNAQKFFLRYDQEKLIQKFHLHADEGLSDGAVEVLDDRGDGMLLALCDVDGTAELPVGTAHLRTVSGFERDHAAVDGLLLGDRCLERDLLHDDDPDLPLAELAVVPGVPQLDDLVHGTDVQIETHVLQPAFSAFVVRPHVVESVPDVGMGFTDQSY